MTKRCRASHAILALTPPATPLHDLKKSFCCLFFALLFPARMNGFSGDDRGRVVAGGSREGAPAGAIVRITPCRHTKGDKRLLGETNQ